MKKLWTLGIGILCFGTLFAHPNEQASSQKAQAKHYKQQPKREITPNASPLVSSPKSFLGKLRPDFQGRLPYQN